MTFWQKLKYLFSTKDLIFTILIFVVVIAFAMCNSATLVTVTFGEDSVDIVSAQFSMNIPYDMVESIELVDMPEAGEVVKGKDDIALRTGVWNNEVWGEYHACQDLQTDNCIAVYLDDGRVFVFSRKSNEDTAADFEIFQGYLTPETA